MTHRTVVWQSTQKLLLSQTALMADSANWDNQWIGFMIVMVPLAGYGCLLLWGIQDWLRNGRKKTNSNYFENRAR